MNKRSIYRVTALIALLAAFIAVITVARAQNDISNITPINPAQNALHGLSQVIGNIIHTIASWLQSIGINLGKIWGLFKDLFIALFEALIKLFQWIFSFMGKLVHRA